MNQNLGIIDEQKAKELADIDRTKEQVARAKKWQDDQTQFDVYVKQDELLSMADDLKQLGEPLGWQAFETKLKRIKNGHRLIFVEHSLRPFRAVHWRDSTGWLHYISAYGRTVLPEFSTIVCEPKIIRDFSVTHLRPNDFPEMEWDGPRSLGFHNLHEAKGFKPKYSGDLMPGWKKIYEPIGEHPDNPMARGWRGVLLRMPMPDLTTPSELESIFGPANRASWQVHMGKSDQLRPF